MPHNTKICNVCEIEKNNDEFHLGRKVCRSCFNVYRKNYTQKNREKINANRKLYIKNNQRKFAEYQRRSIRNRKLRGTYINHKKIRRDNLLLELKSKPCTDCKKTFSSCCMDFDHVHDKEFGIGKRKYGALGRLINEIKKCELVCACCHRIRTHNRKEQQKIKRTGEGK